MNRIIRFFPNADLRCMQPGLSRLAKSYGIECGSLKPGEFAVFMNRKQNRIKVFAPGNIVASYYRPDQGRIDLDMIRRIPKYFNGASFKFDSAINETVLTKWRQAA